MILISSESLTTPRVKIQPLRRQTETRASSKTNVGGLLQPIKRAEPLFATTVWAVVSASCRRLVRLSAHGACQKAGADIGRVEVCQKRRDSHGDNGWKKIQRRRNCLGSAV